MPELKHDARQAWPQNACQKIPRLTGRTASGKAMACYLLLAALRRDLPLIKACVPPHSCLAKRSPCHPIFPPTHLQAKARLTAGNAGSLPPVGTRLCLIAARCSALSRAACPVCKCASSTGANARAPSPKFAPARKPGRCRPAVNKSTFGMAWVLHIGCLHRPFCCKNPLCQPFGHLPQPSG